MNSLKDKVRNQLNGLGKSKNKILGVPMDQINGIDSLSKKPHVDKIKSKSSGSLESVEGPQAASPSQQTSAVKQYEFKMEQADHAFALMMEIREKIEKKYEEIKESSST